MRTVSADLQTAITQPVVNLIYLCKIGFDGGEVCWNSSLMDITYNGDVYVGRGALGSISATKEEGGTAPATINITLSGINPTVVSLMQTEPYQSRPVWVYGAITDENFVFDADLVFALFHGMIDSVRATIGSSASFSISVRSRLADWERQRSLKYTDADQQKLHPGDKGLEFVAQLSQRKLIWPKAEFLPDPRD